MPRGKRGTGPGARKRLQRDLGYPTDSGSYVSLQLTREETHLIYDALRGLPAKMGTRQGAIATNVLYRITEQVMAREVEPEPLPLQLRRTKGRSRRLT